MNPTAIRNVSAYSGIIEDTLARNSATMTLAAPASAMIPFENTSLCPRFVSCLGMNASPAWKLASRGKSANEVFAARIRISVVDTWSSRNSKWPAAPDP